MLRERLSAEGIGCQYMGCTIAIIALICLITGPIGWAVGVFLSISFLAYAVISGFKSNKKQNDEMVEWQRKDKELKAIKAKGKRRKESLWNALTQTGHVCDSTDIERECITCVNGHTYRFQDFQYAAGTEVHTSTNRKTTHHVSTVQNTTFARPTDTWGFDTGGPGIRYDSEQQLVTPGTEVETTTNSSIIWKEGCPACKTTLFTFQNSAFNNFVKCGNKEEFEDLAARRNTIYRHNELPRVKYRHHWYRGTNLVCPYCSPEMIVVACTHCGQKNQTPSACATEGVCGHCGKLLVQANHER